MSCQLVNEWLSKLNTPNVSKPRYHRDPNLTLSSYVGKVISPLNGGKREFINCEYLELLRKQLEDITELPEEDEEIFQACENYLEALASIAL